MKKLLCAILSLLLAASALGFTAFADPGDPNPLINSLYKLNVDKELTVGYFGGSITVGIGSTGNSTASNGYVTSPNSWRALTKAWLETTFPQATINERFAAISNTGSKYGVFRAEKHYIQDKAPDLNFIEMCANDNYDGIYPDPFTKGADEQYVYVESIVKKIYASNPKADIIFIITGSNGMLKNDAINNTTIFGTSYRQIADYYGIPVLYVGQKLAREIYLANGSSFPGSSDAAWLNYFADNVHPNNNGHAHYAETIKAFLSENLPTAQIPSASDYVNKPQPATSYCAANGKGALMLDADMILPDSTAFPSTEYLGGFRLSKGSDGYSPAMYDNTSGHVASFTFNAANIGIWVIASPAPNTTNIRYAIDGGSVQSLDLYRGDRTHKIFELATDLGAGTHSIRIFHNDANEIQIRGFLLWGIDGASPSFAAVPYIDPDDADVAIDGCDDFVFDPAKHSYTVAVSNTVGGSIVYPTVTFEGPDGYYAYEIVQAKGLNATAVLFLDNVGNYSFTFVKGAFTNERRTGAGYIAETADAAERTYGVLAGVQLADWIDLGKVRSIGFYGYLPESNTPVVRMSSAATLATLADFERRYYAMICDIASIDEQIVLKPFAVIDSTTYTGSAFTVVPSALNANDTYYGPKAAVEAFFYDGSIENGLFNPQSAADEQTALNYLAGQGKYAGIRKHTK